MDTKSYYPPCGGCKCLVQDNRAVWGVRCAREMRYSDFSCFEERTVPVAVSKPTLNPLAAPNPAGKALEEKPDMHPSSQPCPTCGGKDIYRRFYPKGAEVPLPGVRGLENAFAKYVRVGDARWISVHQAVESHINNVCRCCGFEWQVLPLEGWDKL